MELCMYYFSESVRVATPNAVSPSVHQSLLRRSIIEICLHQGFPGQFTIYPVRLSISIITIDKYNRYINYCHTWYLYCRSRSVRCRCSDGVMRSVL